MEEKLNIFSTVPHFNLDLCWKNFADFQMMNTRSALSSVLCLLVLLNCVLAATSHILPFRFAIYILSIHNLL